jgi:hypothetical protein
MFDSLESLPPTLVIPVIYRTTLALVSESYRTQKSITRNPQFESSRGNSRRAQDKVINIETARILSEIQKLEGKPLSDLTEPEIKKYIQRLSLLAVQYAAKSYAGSSLSNTEANKMLAKLRRDYSHQKTGVNS